MTNKEQIEILQRASTDAATYLLKVRSNLTLASDCLQKMKDAIKNLEYEDVQRKSCEERFAEAVFAAIKQTMNESDLALFEVLYDTWVNGTVLADPLSVGLLAPKLEWAREYAKTERSTYALNNLILAALINMAVPDICPELAAPEKSDKEDESCAY